MFHAKLNDGSILKRLIDSLKDLVQEVNLDVQTSGLTIQAMDSSHIALVSLKLLADGFEEYRCDKTMALGIAIQNIAKILKICEAGDSVTLDCDEKEHEKLKITFENTKNKRSSEFDLALIALDNDQLGIPEKQYTSQVELSSQVLTKICKDLSSLSESVTIHATKSFVKFNVAGDSVSGGFKLEDCDSSDLSERCVIKNETDINLTFALKYLNIFTKAGSLSPTVILHLSTQFPLKLEFNIADLGSLKFYLAPKMAEDE